MQRTDDFSIQHFIDKGIERVTHLYAQTAALRDAHPHAAWDVARGMVLAAFGEVLITLQVSDWTPVAGS